MLPVGLTTAEGIAAGSSSFNESDRFMIGLAMCRERGVPNKAFLVSSIQEDRKRFGGIVNGQYGAYVTRNLFNNAGSYGAQIYGVRIVGAGSTAASSGALTYNSGNTQAWVMQNLVVHSATLKAKRAYYPVFVEKGDTFRFAVDAVPNYVSFVATEASPKNVCDNLAALLNANGTFSASWTAVSKDDYIEVEVKAVNTAFSVNLAASTIDAGANAVAFCTVKAGQQGLEDPGTWANNRVGVIFNPPGSNGVGIITVDITFLENGVNSIVESYSARTFAEIVAQINSISYYVVLSGVNAGHYPAAGMTTVLSNGTYAAPASEADFYPVSGNAPAGLACFDGVNVQILANTEYHTATMALQGREYAATNRMMYVCVAPYLVSDANLLAMAQVLQSSNERGSYVCAYHMWVNTSDENGGYTWVPALGWILGGGFIRVPKNNLDRVWIAPAGMESSVADAITVTPANLSQAQINLYVQKYTFNVPKFLNGTGYFILTSRTMSTSSLFHSIHIRRLTNYVRDLLELNMRYLLQKPNTPEVRKEGVAKITQLMKTLYDDGAIERSVPFEKAVKVICDVSNNPPTQNRKDLNMDTYWIPTECIESMLIRLNRNDGVLQTALIEQQN